MAVSSAAASGTAGQNSGAERSETELGGAAVVEEVCSEATIECIRAVGQEAIVRDLLWEAEGGYKESPTPVGRVDLLTETEVIEVKHVRQWKQALGQVLCYKIYCPSVTPRVHLYGHVTARSQMVIEDSCRKLKVRVTWAETPETFEDLVVNDVVTDTHWVGRYYVDRGNRRFFYYRYYWMEEGKTRHIHVPGGDITSNAARANKDRIEKAIVSGKSISEVCAMVRGIPKSR
ncbi:MAG TPA: hypothetical protein V6C63_12245 [Allocoleopsis sp.]